MGKVRRDCARRASRYVNSYKNGNTRDDLVDLLADVLHFCDVTKIDYASAITTARMHHTEESKDVHP